MLTVKLRDLGLAAALASHGFEVLEIERDVSGQAYFVFAQTDELERTSSAYWADTLDVKAQTYSNAIKALKSRIYNGR